MGAVSIRVLAQSAVRAMKDAGVQKSLLNVHAYAGFGELCRRFEVRGVADYSPELAEMVVREVRVEFERGAVSSWKWTAVRRCAALLEAFHRTGTLDLPPLPTRNGLWMPPTAEQLAEEGNLHVLIWDTQRLMRDRGLSAKTLRNYSYDGFQRIFHAHQEQGLARHSPRVIADLLDRSRVLLENGAMCPSVWRGLRTCAAVLNEVAATGRLEPRVRYQPRWGLRQPGKELQTALDRFCVAVACDFGWGEGTVAVAKSSVRRFLFAVEDAGVAAVGGFTPRVVSDAVTMAARCRAGGLGVWLFAVRGFLKHLHAVGATVIDLSTAVPQLPAPHRVVREGFTAEEVRTLLASAGGSVIDKRDRAIMTLAAQTGLRACDLARLRRGDIDWRTNEIRIVQAKTGRALCLPLEADSGNAIVDYLLGCRVPGDSPYLFVCCGAGPIRPLSGRTISAVVTGRMRRCGLNDRVPRRGAHSFRRGLGTRMLEAEIPVDTLQQVLGHKHIDSARPYLSVNEIGLRDCAISLATAVGAGEPS